MNERTMRRISIRCVLFIFAKTHVYSFLHIYDNDINGDDDDDDDDDDDEEEEEDYSA